MALPVRDADTPRTLVDRVADMLAGACPFLPPEAVRAMAISKHPWNSAVAEAETMPALVVVR